MLVWCFRIHLRFKHALLDINLNYLGKLDNSLLVNGKREGNVLFNDALNTFFIYGYMASDMVKNHSDKE